MSVKDSWVLGSIGLDWCVNDTVQVCCGKLYNLHTLSVPAISLQVGGCRSGPGVLTPRGSICDADPEAEIEPNHQLCVGGSPRPGDW
jgi:hypothetical protein